MLNCGRVEVRTTRNFNLNPRTWFRIVRRLAQSVRQRFSTTFAERVVIKPPKHEAKTFDVLLTIEQFLDLQDSNYNLNFEPVIYRLGNLQMR